MIRKNYLKTIYNLMYLVRNETEADRVDVDTVSSMTESLNILLEKKDIIDEIQEDFEEDLIVVEDEEEDDDDVNDDDIGDDEYSVTDLNDIKDNLG